MASRNELEVQMHLTSAPHSAGNPLPAQTCYRDVRTSCLYTDEREMKKTYSALGEFADALRGSDGDESSDSNGRELHDGDSECL